MSDDGALFLWFALTFLCLLGLASWAVVETAYLGVRTWHSFRCWWLYGRHGHAYRRSVRALKRRYERMQEAQKMYGHLRFSSGRFGGGSER
jgi:hypothetical protein